MPVGATVVFSSVAGRFGNQGQTDYAAANDLLCKLTSAMRRERPQTRALALDWTAWGGIGMATRGSIPKIMETGRGAAAPARGGRRLGPPRAHGHGILRRGHRRGRAWARWPPSSMRREAPTQPASRRRPRTGRWSARCRWSATDGVVVRTTLDPARQPFLDDHRIDGTPVLPGVMGMEAFAEAAVLAAPDGYRLDAVEDVDVPVAR